MMVFKAVGFIALKHVKGIKSRKKITYFEYYGHISGQPSSETKVLLPLKSYKEKQEEWSVVWNGLSMRESKQD